MRIPVRFAAAPAMLLLWGLPAAAQHPHPAPRPGPSTQTVSPDGGTTYVDTAEGLFPPGDPIIDPPGTNFYPTVASNMFDGSGAEMPNTLPSTASDPYKLHDGPVVSTPIDATSPTQELRALFRRVRNQAAHGTVDREALRRAQDILEGNPVPGRVWSGFPLLHYTGPLKLKRVEPTFDDAGNKIGGNVNVHQVWFDTHIESDTAFLDPSDVQDVPWTITYAVDVLHRAHDDFSPFTMYFDDPALSPPGSPPMPHVAMDQSFFPMDQGTRNVFRIKMSLGKYYNLTYTWGWRVHPPRVQVMENALKAIGGTTLPEWEAAVFGPDPLASRAAQLAAIARISDMAPAKRMWRAVRVARIAPVWMVMWLMQRAELALDDWFNRTRLPSGFAPDPGSDLTLLYANNTLYGEWADGRTINRWFEWTQRPATLKVALINSDYFDHAYVNVDFGGSRGWENQFHSTVPLGGSGCWFSFGRVHWWVNAGGPWGSIVVPAAAGPRRPGRHKVEITYHFEPSRRLRLYQFDPLHHDVAVYSVH